MRSTLFAFAAPIVLAVAAHAAAPAPAAAPVAPAPAAAPAPATPEQTVVVGPTGKSIVVTPKLLEGMDREQATMINHGQSHTYEGVLLTELLRLVGAPTGARLHAGADRNYLVVTGGDGFRAVYSLAETDGSVQRRPVILADKMDGAPLIPHDAPYRLVVDGDQKPARSVYAVSKIEVKVLP
ncbi:MAG TPA: molybdopterin-dependent oxidoreductase [Caulobacteraceae bacterium]|nr:molybdopterin-dependent oxidoreductase [Caulobacteraceae bacterium]